MNHQEWLDWRRNGIGASDAAVLMGVSPWTTPYQLWEDKVFGKTKSDNSNMQRGRDLEEKARCEFEKEMNVSVFPKYMEMTTYPFIRASLDGIDMDGDVMVEIKCPNKEDHEKALNNEVPEKYYPQCQHQMLVAGQGNMYYYSFDGEKGKIVPVRRDEEYINDMFEREVKFWNTHVINKIPPEMTERDYVCMEEETSWLYLCKRFDNTKEDIKILEKDLEEMKQEMIDIAGNRNAEGYGYKMTKSMCKGGINTRDMMQDFPDLPWEKYRNASFIKWNIKPPNN